MRAPGRPILRRVLPEKPTPLDTEFHFRNLLSEEGLTQPDRVEYDPEPNELVFIWHEPKVAIVIELSEDGPVDVRDGTPVPPV